MEDKELQELEEFSLEDIIREFSDHPYEDPAEEPAEAVIADDTQEEASAEETAAEEDSPEEEAPAEDVPAEETPAENVLVEESPAEKEVPTEEVTAEELPAEEMPIEEVAEELREETPAAVSFDTVRLDSAQILKGVVRNAQPIADEEEMIASDTIRLLLRVPPDPDGWCQKQQKKRHLLLPVNGSLSTSSPWASMCRPSPSHFPPVPTPGR